MAAKGATVYPQQLGVACSWNPELATVKTEQTAEVMRSVGATLALSPMVDLIRTAHWPRIEESYGEDGYLSAAMGVAFVEGLQKNGLKDGVAACTKHFLTLATNYNNISTIYQAMGELKKALEYQEKALKIREEILGRETS